MELKEYGKTYQEYKAELDAELNRTAEGFVRIGYLLKVARDTDILKESGYDNVVDFAQAEYSIDKTQVSRFIRINDKFAENGYGDRLEERFRGYGYAKLTLMLALPDEINEGLTPEYSKAEIQAIKDEVDEEQKVTDIELLIEGEESHTAAVESILEKVVRQLGKDVPKEYGIPLVYKKVWEAARQKDWNEKKLEEVLAPSGVNTYSVRIPGLGRRALMLKDSDSGNEVRIVDERTGEANIYSWAELYEAFEKIVYADRFRAGEDEHTLEKDWQDLYNQEWPLKAEVAPVQPDETPKEKKPEKRKESRVTKAIEPKKKPKEPDKKPEQMTIPGAAPNPAPEEPETQVNDSSSREIDADNQNTDTMGSEEQVPGQTDIENDFPQYCPGDQRTAYCQSIRGSVENLVRYVEMDLISAARQQLSDISSYLDRLEELSKGGGPDGEDVETGESAGV